MNPAEELSREIVQRWLEAQPRDLQDILMSYASPVLSGNVLYLEFESVHFLRGMVLQYGRLIQPSNIPPLKVLLGVDKHPTDRSFRPIAP
jgi:hypothetical protein